VGAAATGALPTVAAGACVGTATGGKVGRAIGVEVAIDSRTAVGATVGGAETLPAPGPATADGLAVPVLSGAGPAATTTPGTPAGFAAAADAPASWVGMVGAGDEVTTPATTPVISPASAAATTSHGSGQLRSDGGGAPTDTGGRGATSVPRRAPTAPVGRRAAA
jgi:hypothetical protein